MPRTRHVPAAAGRSGVVLLVVISLLVLFALIGIAFVVYAESQANTARIWREGETLQQPDMDPELLLSYFLGQLIYDTDNPFSALRGHSLARTMYGAPGGTLPYAGTGRVHTAANAAQDDYYQVDYTNYSGGAPRNPDQYGSANAPYTYPDFNNMFLAAQRAADSSVLVPSYYRLGPDGKTPISLRPNTSYHTGFSPQADPSGDVKNLADSPGYSNGPNDSIWIDLGFPVMRAPDGRKFKPLFAPLVLDLDNRVNVNWHGNRNGWGDPNAAWQSTSREAQYCTSWQGYGPWEVNLERVLSASDPQAQIESRRILVGNNGVQGRWDPKLYLQGPNASIGFALPHEARIIGRFYSQTDINAHLPSKGHISLPGSPQFRDWWGAMSPAGMPACPATSCFPYFMSTHNCDNMWAWPNEFPYPSYYNYFDPAGWTSYAKYGWAPKDRRFPFSDMESLLRYGDTGSPALLSDLFKLCPNSMADSKMRKLVTTTSTDIDRPGVYPYIWDPNAQPSQLQAGSLYPNPTPIAFPPLGATPPANSEFSPNWRAVTAALSRIDLNRPLPDYPSPDPNSQQIGDIAGFQRAQQARQQLAKDIFDCARRITGAADPATTKPGSLEFDNLRWLAQLAVNMVDYIDKDDYMTPFNWTGNEWVFGTELPHIVLKEAYAELVNDPADLQVSKATKPYQVNFWVELHNGYQNVDSGEYPPMPDNAAARLQTSGGTPIYQLVIAQSPNSNLRAPSNVRGEADQGQTKAIVSSFTPNLVKPANGAASDNSPGGGNGYYVLGAKATLPGNGNTTPVTCQPKSDTTQQPAKGMTYAQDTLPMQFPNNLPTHTLLLRRLCCPNLPYNPTPDDPQYNANLQVNPYITIDYFEDLPTYDAVSFDKNGMHASTTPNQYGSTRRNQPYAGDITQQKAQPGQQQAGQPPQNTFFTLNPALVNPFDWLVFIDRTVINPMELLQVSAFKPHELTQQFMTGGIDPNTGKAQNRYAHRAPWYDEKARIYRLFEFLEADFRMQGVTVGGRVPGKININTVWDVETWLAICDANVNNYFSDSDVSNQFQQILTQRTPQLVPGPSDRPFRGYATAYAPPGDPQYPNGSGIEDTLLRSNIANPGPRLFEYNTPPYLNGNPYMKSEIMMKTFSRLTTRSNVFAVWVTAGFFEVLDDSDPTRPPKLGTEIGLAENRHIRHRMFAVLDRTNLTFDPANPQSPGRAPFFMDVLSSVAGAGRTDVTLPTVSGMYEDLSFSIKPGDQLMIDVGTSQEPITVIGVNVAASSITAQFGKAHQSLGVPITNVGGTTQLGNPGPQPRFDFRNPIYKGVVRYCSIIQ
jgi:hypothetical protein